MAMGRTLDYNATLTRRDEVTDGLAVFHVELDEPLEPKSDTGLAFLPGQYLTIGLNREDDDPADGRPLSVLRPMTIASAPQAGQLEFFVQYVDKPGSRLPLTHLMWELGEGARLYVRPSATGRFTQEDTFGLLEDRTLVMLAGGTGLAPFVSRVRALAEDPERDLKDHALVYGVSSPTHLGYHDELQALAETRGLRYLPVVSRKHESPDWDGAFGRIEELLDPERIADTESALGVELKPDKAVVMVCGLGATLSGCIERLLTRGFMSEHRRLRKSLGVEEGVEATLFCEQYDGEPLFDLKNKVVVAHLSARWAAAHR